MILLLTSFLLIFLTLFNNLTEFLDPLKEVLLFLCFYGVDLGEFFDIFNTGVAKVDLSDLN